MLEATLSRLLVLPARLSDLCRIGGGEGGSIGAIDTRPAINDTRCCDERRRGCGAVGEREGVGNLDDLGVVDSSGDDEREYTDGSVERAEVSILEGIGVTLVTTRITFALSWETPFGVLLPRLDSSALGNDGSYTGCRRVSFCGRESVFCCGEPFWEKRESEVSSFWSQSNPLPIEVTPQLPTLAALYSRAGSCGVHSSLSKAKSNWGGAESIERLKIFALIRIVCEKRRRR